jgi:RHS repeat-associated protein
MTARWNSLSDLLKFCSKKNPHVRHNRQRRAPSALAVQMEMLEQRLMLTAVSWNTDADGFWDVASNWSTGQVPNSGDDVTIDRGTANPTITIRDSRSINSIVDQESLVVASGTLRVNTSTQIDGGSLTLATGAEIDAFGTMSITDTANFDWQGGTLFTQGLTNAGVITIAPTTSVRLAGLLTNNGTIIQAGDGTLTFDGSTEILNNPGALYDIQGDGGIASSGFTGGFAPFIQNNGTLRKSTGTGTSTVSDISVNSSATGVFDILAGRYRVATHSNLAGGTFTGGAAGVMELAGSVIVTGTLTSSGAGQLQLTGDLNTQSQATTLNFSEGYFQWLSGSITGNGPGLTNAGFMDIAGAADKAVVGKLIDTGTIQHTGLGNLLIDTASSFQISSTGLYDFQNDGGWGSVSLNGGGQPFFEVQGTVRKSGGTGTTLFTGGANPLRLDLQGGTLDVESGTVNLADGGLWQSGELDVATGAVLQLTGSAIAATGTFTGSGSGRIELNTSVASYDFGVAGSHATFNFPQNLLHWQSGTIGSGGSASSVGSATVFVNAGFMILDGTQTKSLSGTGLINTGTMINAGSGIFDISSSTLTNRAGAVFDEQGDVPFNGTDGPNGAGNPGHFVNAGTFKKSAGTGTVNYTGLFDNPSTGIIEIDSGHMQFSRGGTLGGTNIQVGAGAILELTGNGFFEMSGTYTGTGPGTILFNSKMEGFDPGDPARLNFPQGMFEINAGVNQGFFGTIINDGWINDTSIATVYMRANFTNNGTFIQSGTANLQLNANTHFTNNGLYDLQSDASLVVPSDGSGGSMVFTNNGVFQKSGGTGTSAFRHAADGNEFHLENPGTIDVKSGTLSINDSVAQRSGTTLTGGTWIVENSATLTMPGIGNVTVNQANVTLSGPTASFTNLNALANNQGQLTLAGGTDFTTIGNLSNSGSLTLGAGSVLTVAGNYTQAGGTSSLNEMIGGRPASGLAGKLVATGQASLAGRLVFNLTDGFGPTLGDQYQVLQYASKTGGFGLIAGLSPFFSVDVQAAQTLLTAIGAGVNTSVQSVTPPANAVVGQNVSIPFTVHNDDATAIIGNWTDSVYLSSDGTLSADDVLVARVPHAGGLAANGSYTGTANGILPNVIDGDYHVIVVADSSGEIADTNRTDNTLASNAVIHVTVPTLTLGTPTTGVLTDNQDKLFRVDISSNGDVILAGTFAVPYEAEFLVGYGRVPTTGRFDFAATNLADLNRQIVISSPQAGPYYILLVGREGASTPQSFSLTARQPGFEVRSIGPSHGSNQGQTTLTISGSGFTPSSTATLIAPDNSGSSATSIVYVDSNTLYATFNLHNLAASSGYDVRVENGVQTATATDVFTVNSGVSAAVQVSVSTPQFLRGGTTGTVTIDYFNPGETDIAAPLLRLASDNARFQMPGSSTFTDDSVLLLGINANGPAGVLPPGSHQSITLPFQPKVTGPHVTSEFDVAVADPTLVIDWAGLKAELRPSNVTTDAWDVIYANFLKAVGTTQGDLQKVLDTAATYLSSLNETTSDPNDLLSLVMQDAGAYSEIADRYRLGAFGRGQADPTTIQLSADISGVISINYGGFLRTFTRQANGTYQGQAGDFATLSQVNGNFQLRETDGTQYVFLSNGLVNYIQSADGNRITFGYSNGRLVTQTNSIGDTVTYAYNGQGRVSQLTDAVGRITTFTYDSSGEHLLSIANAAGTTTYSYVTGQGAAREHAVQSMTNPDGTHLFFTYDTQGRVLTVSHDGGTGTLTYAYNGLGQISVTDADGQKVVVSTDAFGQTARVLGPLNGVISFSYDQNRNLAQYTVSGNATTTIARDALGNQIQTVDPLGNVVSSQYTQNLNQLQNVTGPNGNSVLSFAYDSHGNLITQTTADQAAGHYLYDSRGNLTQKTDAAANVTKYSYDSKNLLTHVVYQDGSTVDYAYDAHRNLITITDASGVIAQTYDAADRVTSVVYPDGRSLHYSYDAGGRATQILTQDGFATNYHYDAVGRLASTTDASGNTTVAYQYDAVNRLSRRTLGNGEYTTYAYNGRSQVTSLINHAADGTIESQYVYTYDSQGRPLTMTTNEGTTTYGFDATGQLTSVTLPDGRVIHYQYDAAGNRIAVNDGGTETDYSTNSANQYTDVGATHYTYDANGNLATKTDGTGTTTYTYDARNRLVGIVSPTDTWANEYDALGDLVAVVHNGQRTEYLVDSLGLSNVVGEYDGTGSLIAHYSQGSDLSSRVDASGASQYYQYDGSGNTTSLSDASGSVLDSYSYLPFGGQLTSTGSTPNPFTYVGAAGVMDQGQGLYYMRNRWYDPSTGRFTSPDPSGLQGGDANLYRYTNNRAVDVADPTGLAFGPIGPGDGNHGPGKGPGGPGKVPPVGNGPPNPGDRPPGEPGGEGGGNGGNGGTGQGGTGEGGAAKEIPTSEADAVAKSPELAETAEVEEVEGLVVEGAETGAGGTAALLLLEFGIIYGATREVSSATGLDGIVANDLERRYFDHSHDDPFANLNVSDSYRRKIQDSLDSGHTWEESFGRIRDRNKGQQIFSGDPNDLLGPPPFVQNDQSLPYTIDFENIPDASAPAQSVAITETLDSDLDLSTFQLGNIGFGSTTIDVPAGLTAFSTRVSLAAADDIGGAALNVDVTANLNFLTRVVNWTFTTLDPLTGDVPANPLAGFLPANVVDPEGQGFVNYTVRPNAGLHTGAAIDSQATVVFDTNAAIDTPHVTTTIDDGAPTSTVTTLPSTQDFPSFQVSWSGTDDAAGPTGSGIAFYDVYVSDNGGVFAPFLLGTTLTTSVFTGQVDHTYSFYSVATDNVGLQQTVPVTGQTSTQVLDVLFDFGDAPDPLFGTAGKYPTLLADDGARHMLGSGLFLGSGVDAESDGQPTTTANGDDINGASDDEDGVAFLNLVRGTTGTATVIASMAGKLDAWIDFNHDGDWSDPGEQIATSLSLNAGSNTVSFAIPAGAIAGNTYARFRLSSAGGLSYTGAAADGEVEDYQIQIAAPLLSQDGGAVTWTNKQPAVTVLPQVTVPFSNLTNGILAISINAVGTKKTSLDIVTFPSAAALGTTSGAIYANGHITMTILLSGSVTSSAVQSFLHGITFATKGKGLRTESRAMIVTLSNSSHVSNTITQTVHVIKKAPHVKHQ